MMRSRFFISPLVGHLTCFILGISAQKACSLNLSLLFAAFISTLATVIILHLSKKSSFSSLVALQSLSVATGALLFALQVNNYNTLVQYYSGKNMDITGSLMQLEQDKLGAFKEMYHITVTGIRTAPGKQWLKASFSLLVYARQRSQLAIADTATITNVTIKPPANPASSTSSFTTYLIKENVITSLFLSEKNTVTRTHRPSWSVARTLWLYKNSIQHEIKKRLSRISGSMFGLIFLGNKNQEALSKLRDVFNYWGLAHYLARSGLHIVLFVIIWSFFFKFLPLHLYVKRTLLLCLTIIYAGLSWSSISFFRAYLVFLLMQLGALCEAIPNTLHLLSLTCLGILLFNPIQLFFLDFQLTFLLTFALLFLGTLSKQ